MSIKHTILYVDDEPINLRLFEVNFRRKYNVITALDGTIGLSKLKENPTVEVVISDMKMPKMTGIEFVSKAKLDYPDKTYFILTGFDRTDEISLAMETKLIAAYFTKPFNMNTLIETIDTALGRC